jgi:glyoxylase-like metal-dependent hydrolase (beta-lactamase superfamily II)
MIDRPFQLLQFNEDLIRLTQPLRLGIDHVHCYLLRSSGGGWTLVDAGLGLPAPEQRWSPVLAALDGPVERVFVTHFHPDHVGGSRDVAELAGAPVLQGRLDFERCVSAWADPARSRRAVRDHLRANGMDEAEIAAVSAHHHDVIGVVRYAPDPELLDAGDDLDGWEILHLPGHADGHLALLRDGVLIAGDALLGGITPNVGLFPGSNPDPLADFVASLELLARLAPRIAYAGHGEPIEDPAGRASEILDHHRERLASTLAVVDGRARTGSQVAFDLFPDALTPPLRRFAIAEALAHLEHLALAGSLERHDGDGRTLYQAA